MNKYEELHEKWQHYLQDYEKSGLTQSAWCRKNQIPAHQLSYWKKKFMEKNADIVRSTCTSLLR